MADRGSENPSVDEALGAVLQAMQSGSTFPLDEDSRQLIPSLYRGSFERRLQLEGVWADEKNAVLNAARQVGVIASAIATLQFQRDPRLVRRWMVDAAAALVEQYCGVGEEEGQWCKRNL
jgi:hypothetical protein